MSVALRNLDPYGPTLSLLELQRGELSEQPRVTGQGKPTLRQEHADASEPVLLAVGGGRNLDHPTGAAAK
jgi:hypothetical protein